jgi:hypothetical protein
MRNSTSRALRATATVAGVAALGATFVGTAAADTGSPLGNNNYRAADNGGLGNLNGLGGSDGSGKTIMDEPGLANFELPGMGTQSRGLRTDSDFGDFGNFGSNDDDWDYRGRGDDSSHYCHSDDSKHRYGNSTFQNPMQCKHDNYFKNDDFNILGHNFRTAYQGKSIGSRGMRTDGPFDGFGGGDNWGGNGSHDGNMDFNKFYSHNNNGQHSESDGPDYSEGDGLSGHTIKLPLHT